MPLSTDNIRTPIILDIPNQRVGVSVKVRVSLMDSPSRRPPDPWPGILLMKPHGPDYNLITQTRKHQP